MCVSNTRACVCVCVCGGGGGKRAKSVKEQLTLLNDRIKQLINRQINVSKSKTKGGGGGGRRS